MIPSRGGSAPSLHAAQLTRRLCLSSHPRPTFSQVGLCLVHERKAGNQLGSPLLSCRQRSARSVFSATNENDEQDARTHTEGGRQDTSFHTECPIAAYLSP